MGRHRGTKEGWAALHAPFVSVLCPGGHGRWRKKREPSAGMVRNMIYVLINAWRPDRRSRIYVLGYFGGMPVCFVSSVGFALGFAPIAYRFLKHFVMALLWVIVRGVFANCGVRFSLPQRGAVHVLPATS